MSVAAEPGRRGAMPRVLHVTRYPFDPNRHPAIWRTIVGLSSHFRTVVVSGTQPGYFPEPALDEARLAAAAEIQVLPDQDVDGLPRPEVAAAIAATVLRHYGPIHAVVGHLLGGSRSFYLARQLAVPMLAFFHGDDANIHLHGEEHGPAYAGLRAAPGASSSRCRRIWSTVLSRSGCRQSGPFSSTWASICPDIGCRSGPTQFGR